MGQKISVIIPAYNSAEWLETCLNSVFNQTYSNIEILAIDDCSKDETFQILKKYEKKHSNFKVVKHQETKGVGAARNTGVNLSTGDYITFLDSDDEWTNDFCQTLMEIIEDADIAVAGRATFVNGKYTKSKTAPNIEFVDGTAATKYMLLGKYSAHPVWGKLFKRTLIRNISFDENYVFEDIRYSADTMINAQKVVFSNKDLYFYKMREGSIMTTKAELQIRGYVYAAEYVYNRLIESGKFQECDYEFRIFLARGIIRNTRQFMRNDVDTKFFKELNSKIIDLFENLGGL